MTLISRWQSRVCRRWISESDPLEHSLSVCSQTKDNYRHLSEETETTQLHRIKKNICSPNNPLKSSRTVQESTIRHAKWIKYEFRIAEEFSCCVDIADLFGRYFFRDGDYISHEHHHPKRAWKKISYYFSLFRTTFFRMLSNEIINSNVKTT